MMGIPDLRSSPGVYNKQALIAAFMKRSKHGVGGCTSVWAAFAQAEACATEDVDVSFSDAPFVPQASRTRSRPYKGREQQIPPPATARVGITNFCRCAIGPKETDSSRRRRAMAHSGLWYLGEKQERWRHTVAATKAAKSRSRGALSSAPASEQAD
jgi:hypothetical protein